MNVQEFRNRYVSLKEEIEQVLRDEIKQNGGFFSFLEENDKRLDEIDDFSDLNMPFVKAYSWRHGNSHYYITQIFLHCDKIVFYGIEEDGSDVEDDSCEITNIEITGMLDILDSLQEFKK